MVLKMGFKPSPVVPFEIDFVIMDDNGAFHGLILPYKDLSMNNIRRARQIFLKTAKQALRDNVVT